MLDNRYLTKNRRTGDQKDFWTKLEMSQKIPHTESQKKYNSIREEHFLQQNPFESLPSTIISLFFVWTCHFHFKRFCFGFINFKRIFSVRPKRNRWFEELSSHNFLLKLISADLYRVFRSCSIFCCWLYGFLKHVIPSRSKKFLMASEVKWPFSMNRKVVRKLNKFAIFICAHEFC